MTTGQQGHIGGSLFVENVVYNLVAAALGTASTPFVGPFVEGWWLSLFHSSPGNWVTTVVAYLAPAIALIGLFKLATVPARKLLASLRPVADPYGTRLVIYVAKFVGDNPQQTARASVMDSIAEQIGRNAVEVVPANLELVLKEGASRDDAAEPAANRARQLLRRKNGDLLVWGRVHTITGRGICIELRFVSAALDGSDGKRFGFVEDRLTLDRTFGPEMGAALASTVAALALPVIDAAGTDLVPKLTGFAARLERSRQNLPSTISDDDRTRISQSYAMIQSALGEQTGRPELVEKAVVACHDALKESTRERAPLAWARTQNILGYALFVLGKWDSGTTRLNEAIAAFRWALEERKRESTPLDWAATKTNLGIALWALGERETDSAHLEQAVASFRETLQERTRDRVPLQWAKTQHNLANALRILGEREKGVKRLEESVAAHLEALKERTRRLVPLDWAATQNNLGNALLALAERAGNETRLNNAICAYYAALKERRRKHEPLDWAMTRHNLGNAFLAKGTRKKGTFWLKQAVAGYRSALQERTRQLVPIEWAMTQNSLGGALRQIGEREDNAAHLHEAVEAYRDALKEWHRERSPHYWATAQNNLGNALLVLAKRESGTGHLKEALDAFHEALKEWTPQNTPSDFQVVTRNVTQAQALFDQRAGKKPEKDKQVSPRPTQDVVCRASSPVGAPPVQMPSIFQYPDSLFGRYR